MPDYSSHSFIL